MEEFIAFAKKIKIPQTKLAQQLDCSPSYIHQILNGTNNYPPSDHFRKKCYEWMKKCWACGKTINE